MIHSAIQNSEMYICVYHQYVFATCNGFSPEWTYTYIYIYIYTEQKKLRKSQKTMQHKDTKANNYLIFIYLFKYMSSVEKNVDFSLLAPISLLWHSVK